MNTLYDITIIGSGPGGYRAAVLAALRKQKVAIVEKQDWGGCCLNRGCVPKKAWHNTAKILNKNNKLNNIGIKGQLTPDFNTAWQHQHKVTSTIRENYTNYMKRLGIDFFDGHGSIKDKGTSEHHLVHVSNNGQSDHLLSSLNVIIATGSQPKTSQVFDIQSDRILSTDDMFDKLPPEGDDIAIIGSGVIATEFAYILQSLGKDIHWHARSAMLSNSEFSPQAIKALRGKLDTHKLSPVLELPIRAEEKDNKIRIHFQDGSSHEHDWLLLATGRTPFTNDLGLENTNVTLDEAGFVRTNQFLETSEAKIYAIGDVRSQQMTANQAIADANVAVDNIINGNKIEFDETWVPQAIYSAIEMAKIGLDEDAAEDNDYEPAVGFSAFEASPSALGQDETEGYVRIISDMDSGEFLGGEVIGENAAEIIHLMSLPQNKEVSLQDFAKLTVNHPSRTEEIVNATETLANKWGLEAFIFSSPDK